MYPYPLPLSLRHQRAVSVCMYDMYVLGSYRWRVLGIYMETSGHSIPKRGILEVDLEYGSMCHMYIVHTYV